MLTRPIKGPGRWSQKDGGVGAGKGRVPRGPVPLQPRSLPDDRMEKQLSHKHTQHKRVIVITTNLGIAWHNLPSRSWGSVGLALASLVGRAVLLKSRGALV